MNIFRNQSPFYTAQAKFRSDLQKAEMYYYCVNNGCQSQVGPTSTDNCYTEPFLCGIAAERLQLPVPMATVDVLFDCGGIGPCIGHQIVPSWMVQSGTNDCVDNYSPNFFDNERYNGLGGDDGGGNPERWSCTRGQCLQVFHSRVPNSYDTKQQCERQCKVR